MGLISLILGPYIIKSFSNNNLSEVIRNDGPSSHINKSGTPTMGGLLILSSLLVTTLLWANLENKYIQYLIITTLIFAIIGTMIFFLSFYLANDYIYGFTLVAICSSLSLVFSLIYSLFYLRNIKKIKKDL